MPRQAGKKKLKLAKMLGKRFKHSYVIRQQRIAEGDEYTPYIKGEAPTPAVAPGDDRWDEAVEKVKRQERSMGRNWRMTAYPAQGELRRLLLPALSGQDGTWENPAYPTPPNASPEDADKRRIRYGRARLYERLARVIQAEYKIQVQGKMATDEAMQYGLSWFKTWRDDKKDLIGFKHFPCERVLYDEETEKDPLGENHRWRAACYTVSLEDAKVFAEEWGGKGHEFKSASNELSADEQNEYGGELTELPTKFVKLVIVHVRGNSPHIHQAKMDTDPSAKVEKVGKDDVYNGKSRRILMEAQGKWEDAHLYAYIGEKAGPDYITDHNDDCFTPIVLDSNPDKLWGTPIYQSGHSLQVALNWSLRYYNTDLYNSARRVIGVLDGALDPSEETKILYDRDNLNIAHFRSRQDMEAGIRPMDFGPPNPKLIEGVTTNKALFDQATGKSGFAAEGKSHETATMAALRSNESQLVIGSMSDGLERAMVQAMRKALMACREKLTAEQVAEWVGDEYMDWKPSGEFDPKTGQPLMKSDYWNDEVNDPESIRREVEVTLRKRSIRYVSAEQKLNDMDRFQKTVDAWIMKVLEAVQVHPEAAQEIARIGNVAIREYGELLNLNHAEEMQLDLRMLAKPPMAEERARQQAQVDAASAGAQAGVAAGQAESGTVREIAELNTDLGLQNPPGPLGDTVARAQGGY